MRPSERKTSGRINLDDCGAPHMVETDMQLQPTEATMTTEATPGALGSNDQLGFTVGDAVMLRVDLYEGPDEYAPGGYLARRGEKLIVRAVRGGVKWPLSLSHEHRTDGITFGVGAEEVEPWRDRVPLPNDKWIRSPKMPDWAICLDPEARHYGWKMYERNGAWVSGTALQLHEVQGALGKVSLQEHWPLFQPLHDKLAGICEA